MRRKRKRKRTSSDGKQGQWVAEVLVGLYLPSSRTHQTTGENNKQICNGHEQTVCTRHTPARPVSSQCLMSPQYSHTPYIMDWKIPKTCVCKYTCFDSLSKRHLSSNAHNFFLRDRRREMGDPIRGDCDTCGVKNLKHLERHRLTNFHIKRADTEHTATEIKRHTQQLASKSCSSLTEC